MITFLRGKIIEKEPERLTLDVQGVGYAVGIPNSTYQQLPPTGETITIETYHHITDNNQTLYGFYQKSDKNLFKLLITVKNIGPKLGLAILSGMNGKEIIKAISQQDKTALASISGIGKKTAERMILELKEKMEKIAGEFDMSTDDGAPGELKSEALSALESLGYRKKDAEKALKKALDNQQEFGTVNDLVKKALSEFGR